MKAKRKRSERWALFGGLALTVSGVAHLASIHGSIDGVCVC